MKKIYITPYTEVVNVKLINSVLGPGDLPIGHSPFAEDPLAKENDFFEDFDSEEDIWSGRQMKDVWER
jgi:hypothetical protein